MWHLKYTLEFGGMSLSLGIKYLVHPDKLLGILVEAPFPLDLGCVEETILFFIGRKGDIFILLDGLHRTPYLLFSILDHLEIPIIIR